MMGLKWLTNSERPLSCFIYRGLQCLGLLTLCITHSWLPFAASVQAQQIAEGGDTGDKHNPPDPIPPDPIPTPRCQLYELSFQHVQSASRKSERAWFDQTRAQDLSCMTNLYASLNKSHDPRQLSVSANYTGGLWKGLLGKVGSDPGTNDDKVYEANKKYIQCTGEWKSPRRDRHNAHFMMGGGQRGGDKGRKTPGCNKGKLFINSLCQMQVVANVKESVGDCYMTLKAEVASPISLVWSEDYKNEPSTVVNFKLNPHSQSSKWMWRASESLPLLVHDSENKGDITSASQLFGNWTRGGKQVNPPVQWTNGYEALATFDKNGDGAVSGDELSEISLWFDKNRDGVSQEGEVKRATSAGVTHLYLKADREVDGGPFATKGYTRTENGVAKDGSSFDWVEKEASSSDSVALGGISDPGDVSSASSSQPQSDSIGVKITGAATGPSSKLFGQWILERSDNKDSGGVLIFQPDEQGIAGLALKPNGLRNVENVAAEVAFSHFVAKTDVNRAGHLEVAFLVEGVSGARLRNVATLSTDGNTLEGKTVVSRSTLAKSGGYEYTWRARRM